MAKHDNFAELGGQLREARQARDLTLEEVSGQTRIRVKFLEMMESGQTDPSLSEPQMRGFLRNYAQFLRLDPDAVIMAYEEARSGRRRRRNRTTTPPPSGGLTQPVTLAKSPTNNPATSTREITPITNFGIETNLPVSASGVRGLIRLALTGFIILTFIALVVGGIVLFLTSGEGDDGNAVNPPLLEVDSPFTPEAQTSITATPTDPPTPAGIVIAPPAELGTPGITNFNSLSIDVIAQQRSWARVTVDGTVQFQGLMRPGTQIQYQAQSSIALRTSNAGGLEVYLNGQPLGILGERGMVYDQTFTLDALNNPTPTPTATEAPPQPIQTTPLSTPDASAPAGTSAGASDIENAAIAGAAAENPPGAEGAALPNVTDSAPVPSATPTEISPTPGGFVFAPGSPTPSPSPTLAVTETPTPSQTPAFSATPVPSATPVLSATPSVSPTATASPTLAFTATPSLTPTPPATATNNLPDRLTRTPRPDNP